MINDFVLTIKVVMRVGLSIVYIFLGRSMGVACGGEGCED